MSMRSVGSVLLSGSATRRSVGDLLVHRQEGVVYRAITFKDGMLRQMPASAPYGSRMQFDGGYITDVAGGTALVFDTTLAHIRQAAGSDIVIEP